MSQALNIGNNIIWMESVTSTNQVMLETIEKRQLPEGSIIVANHQTAGRGVDNSVWESEAGKNLTFSVLLYPDFLMPDEQFYLTKAISLGLIDLVRDETNEEVFIKWPNDIYIVKKKVAGILIQNGIMGDKIEYFIAGIGLNLNQEIFHESLPNPVSLKDITAKDYDLSQILEKLCKRLNIRYQQLRSGDKKGLDSDYLSVLLRYNKPDHYLYKGEQIIATITGINKYGQLILQIPGKKTMTCDLKEVEYLF